MSRVAHPPSLSSVCVLSYTSSDDGSSVPEVAVLLLLEAGLPLLDKVLPLLPLSMSETLFGLPLPAHMQISLLDPSRANCPLSS